MRETKCDMKLQGWESTQGVLCWELCSVGNKNTSPVRHSARVFSRPGCPPGLMNGWQRLPWKPLVHIHSRCLSIRKGLGRQAQKHTFFKMLHLVAANLLRKHTIGARRWTRWTAYIPFNTIPSTQLDASSCTQDFKFMSPKRTGSGDADWELLLPQECPVFLVTLVFKVTLLMSRSLQLIF